MVYFFFVKFSTTPAHIQLYTKHYYTCYTKWELSDLPF